MKGNRDLVDQRPAIRSTREPTVSVVFPALNEAANLPHVFADLPPGLHQVILVDGGSVDGTVAVARELLPSVEIVSQTRRGKGNALVCGFERCTGDIIVMIDADGLTDPAEIPAFVKALTEGADFAKGTRFSAGGRSAEFTGVRRAGNSFLTATVNVLFRTSFSDLRYGYNAFWRDVLPCLELPGSELPPARDGRKVWGDGLEIGTMINVRAARSFSSSVVEVPSVERERTHGESNLSAVRDGIRVLRTIGQERFGRRSDGRKSARVC